MTPRIYGTKVLGVVNTGDFERADAAFVIRTYRKLAAGDALLPPCVGFLFDRETRTEDQMEDLKREGGGMIDFLSRRMFENYLVEEDELAAVMNECENFRASPISANEVRAWIDQHRFDLHLYPKKTQDATEQRWRSAIDAAKLLKAMFEELSEQRWSYQKISHGVSLTDKILSSRPEVFGELAEQLKTILHPRGMSEISGSEALGTLQDQVAAKRGSKTAGAKRVSL